MNRYSEFKDRILRTATPLAKLFLKDISDRAAWRQTRDADDATIAGGIIGDPRAFPIVSGGLLYAADDLAGCHEFFQDIASSLVSYGHGMMRSVPDVAI